MRGGLSVEAAFLSHACGGKLDVLPTAFFITFLSHACGGKLTKDDNGNIATFLSHACGGKLDRAYVDLTSKGFVLSEPPWHKFGGI